jgi:hypothetical protein
MLKITATYIISFLIFFGVSIFNFSCNQNHKELQQAILKTEVCKKDSNNTYSLYIPSHEKDCGSMPLVVILDPKGMGNTAIQKFIKGSESYKCILAASNLVKNNYTDFVQAIETLVYDAKEKYPVGTKIYLVGFSGAARMALNMAQMRKVNGVLVSGALTLEDEVKSMNTNVYAIFGLGDFNLHEAANFFLNPQGYPANLKLELTNENHEWPSSSSLNRGLGLLILSDYPRESTCIKKSTILKEYSADCKNLVDTLIQGGDYLNAYFISLNLQLLKDLPEKKYFISTYKELKTNPKLENQISQIRKSMQMEFKARDAYSKAFSTSTSEWWIKEVTEINKQIDLEKDKYKLFAFKRIRAFLGIMCYSLTNNNLNNNNLKEAAKNLGLYKLVEPKNPDMFYFTALYLLKSGTQDSISEYLQKAIDAGYVDRKKIIDNFPENISTQFVANSK